MVRAVDSEASGRRFKSCLDHHRFEIKTNDRSEKEKELEEKIKEQEFRIETEERR